MKFDVLIRILAYLIIGWIYLSTHDGNLNLSGFCNPEQTTSCLSMLLSNMLGDL